MKYTFSFSNPVSKYIDIECSIQNNGTGPLLFHLPAWRPGRYELGNFAKNIQSWKPFDEKGKELAFEKISKDCWKVETGKSSTIIIRYNYYANQMDAGGCWLEEKQLYVNPCSLLFVC